MKKSYKAIVMGASAGGMNALEHIVPRLPPEFSLPVIVVNHLLCGSDDFLATHLNALSQVEVTEARHGQVIRPATVYIAPAGYHLLVEENHSLSLSVDRPVNFSIPSIDVLFESASEAYEDTLIAVMLTGGSSDGAEGIKAIKACGGLAVVQDPSSAEVPLMPQSAIDSCQVDHILPLEDIGTLLVSLSYN